MRPVVSMLQFGHCGGKERRGSSRAKRGLARGVESQISDLRPSSFRPGVVLFSIFQKVSRHPILRSPQSAPASQRGTVFANAAPSESSDQCWTATDLTLSLEANVSRSQHPRLLQEEGLSVVKRPHLSANDRHCSDPTDPTSHDSRKRPTR